MFSFLMVLGVVVVNENFVCEYVVGDFFLFLIFFIKGSVNVIFNGKFFIVYRSGGFYVVSLLLIEKKDGMIFIDDKIKVFVVSQDKFNFVVFD